MSLSPPQTEPLFRLGDLVGDVLDTRMWISNLENTESSDDVLLSYSLFLGDILDDSMHLQLPNPYNSETLNLDPILDDNDDAWIRLARHISAHEAPNMQPASQKSIEYLDKVKIGDQEPCLTCTVCLDEISIGSVATRMPSSHVDHQNCIVQWLVTSNMCPLFRYKMPAS
ncbi:unnamed protein product [Dovyalis caffra]|uniref:RING-type E3 ubiquitin transferase n=1 Tax=Dovyalis caffra TaxID=77055 RepID=A0AAV1RFJ4_9ROSI|nr:unnamed protein product [Dovyalis caffra]